MPWEVLQKDSQDIDTQVSAVHAGLLPTKEFGQIVYFGGFSGHADSYLFDVETSEITLISDSPKSNMFCCGHTFLSDGRMLIVGGQNDEEAASHPAETAGEHLGHPNQGPGERSCYLFNPRGPADDKWKRADDLNYQPGSFNRGGGRWYPSVVFLPNGEVFAMGGHPSITDFFLPVDGSDYRHNNNTPERYSPGADVWTYLTDGSNPDDLTADKDVVTDGYHRLHLLPNGMVFFSTKVKKGAPTYNRSYDPYQGKFFGPLVDPVSPSSPAVPDFPTGVLLPLLPDAEGSCNARIMVCGDLQPMRIDLIGDAPKWQEASHRKPDLSNFIRINANSTILPTGDVFVSGGNIPSANPKADPALAVHPAEIYRPGIDWGNNTYDDSNLADSEKEGWRTVEPASIRRGYHSVAFLLPDGRVWTAGSTDFGVADTDIATVHERRIEIYTPDYFSANRPVIKSSPVSVAYDQKFDVFTDQSPDIQRVALNRCGSVTHAFDVDQRYIALNFEKAGGDRLLVTSPLNSNIAPPGFYMLWIVDANGIPCERAKFIRVATHKCFAITDRSTFSLLEVQSLLGEEPSATAPFSKAFYVVLDGFMKHEIGSPPVEPVITFLDPTGVQVPGMRHELNKSPDPEFDDPDIAQRYAFSYDIMFDGAAAFDGLSEENPFRTVTLRVDYGPHFYEATLLLTVKSNPYMRDGDVPWLSIDLQVFSKKTNESFAKVVQGDGPGAGNAFITEVITKLNDPINTKLPEGEHPFAELLKDSDTRQLAIGSKAGDQHVFNYAIARVRYRAAVVEETTAHDVRVFFRVFTTADTGLAFTAETYPRDGEGGNAIAQIGYNFNQITTMPFFAEPRQDNPQPPFDLPNLRDIKGAGEKEVHTYFGCWLDFNQEGEEGAYLLIDKEDGQLKTIQELLLRNDHLCLVAEIYYADDPVLTGETPGSSDNLAQRNLVFGDSDNPGSSATHTVQTTFELKPSSNPSGLAPTFQAGFTRIFEKGPAAPDEILIHWNNLPRESHVTLYMPDVNVREIIAYTNSRLGPNILYPVDNHTINCKVGGITYIPLPARNMNIAGLMTIQLPPSVKSGQEFNIVVQQMSGTRNRIVGTFQFTIPVTTADQILPKETYRLSVMRHVALSIPVTNRWYPIFVRYLDQIADRVRALGGNPDDIAPAADGSGRSSERECCLVQRLIPAVLAPMLVLIGLLRAVWSAPLAALGIVLLVAVVCYWRARCKPSPCDLIHALLLGVGAAGVVLGIVALFGYVSPMLHVMLGVLAILSGILILAAIVGQCWGPCWCRGKLISSRKKKGRYALQQ